MAKQIEITKDQEGMFVVLQTLNSLSQTFYGEFPKKIEEQIVNLIIDIKQELKQKKETEMKTIYCKECEEYAHR